MENWLSGNATLLHFVLLSPLVQGPLGSCYCEGLRLATQEVGSAGIRAFSEQGSEERHLSHPGSQGWGAQHLESVLA